MLNVVNAPVARRRDPRALAFARAQQRFVWESLAREREVDSEAECEADASTPRLGFAALVPPAVAAKRARHGVRTVRCPGGPPGSLGLALSRSAHGHVMVAAVHPTSPLYHELAPGDVVMLVDGETTLHADPAQLQAALPRAPDVEHVLLVCVEDFFGVGGDAPEEAGGEAKVAGEVAHGCANGPERNFSPPPRPVSACLLYTSPSPRD